MRHQKHNTCGAMRHQKHNTCWVLCHQQTRQLLDRFHHSEEQYHAHSTHPADITPPSNTVSNASIIYVPWITQYTVFSHKHNHIADNNYSYIYT